VGDRENKANKDKKKASRKGERDDSVSDSEPEEDDIQNETAESDVTSDEGEAAAEQRARLTQRYLKNIQEEVNETGFDAEDIDKDIITCRPRELPPTTF